MSELHVPKIAILASGSGSTAEAYARQIHRGEVRHEIGLVITNNPEACILGRVERWNDELDFDTGVAVINRETHPEGPNERGQTQEEAEAITELLNQCGIDLVAALGYMVIINDPLVAAYGYVPTKHRSIYDARMVNTHPGPLPLTQDTMGEGASAAVLREAARIEAGNKAYRERGEAGLPVLTQSEHTMHVVSQVVDDPNAVFARHPVDIMPGDTAEKLFQRVQQVEKANVGPAINAFLLDREKYLESQAA